MKKIIKYLTATAICLAGGLAVLLIRGFFSMTDTVAIRNTVVDAFFVPGIIMLAFGGLLFASTHGAFDMLKFGMIEFFGLFRSAKTKRKYKDFYEYKKSKEDRKFTFVHQIIVGALFVVISIVLQLAFGW